MGFTPAAELRGVKLGTFASMVPTMQAQLDRSLEDVTGPIDPRQVQKPPAPRTALPPASNHLGLGPRPRSDGGNSVPQTVSRYRYRFSADSRLPRQPRR